MIDTVRAQVRCEKDPSTLMRSGFRRNVQTILDGEGKEATKVQYVLMDGKFSPHYFCYLPPLASDEKDPGGYLIVEGSAPKSIYGQNYKMLAPGDVPKFFDAFSNLIADRVGDIPNFSEWEVRGRLDFVHTWNVGDRVGDYLHAAKGLHLPRHIQQSVDADKTQYWRNSQRVIRMYDKQAECGYREAEGLLRFEDELKHAKGELARLAGLKSTKLRDVVTWQNAKAVLGDVLGGLGADMLIGDQEKTFKLLVKVYGVTKARRLFGTMQALAMFSQAELVQMSRDRTWVGRDRREISKAGVGSSFSKSGMLPGLRLPADYDGEPLDLKGA